MHRRFTQQVAGASFVLLGIAWAIWRGVLAFSSFQQWREWKLKDPSGAELYQVNCWFDSAFSLIGVVVAVLGLWLVRRGRSAG